MGGASGVPDGRSGNGKGEEMEEGEGGKENERGRRMPKVREEQRHGEGIAGLGQGHLDELRRDCEVDVDGQGGMGRKMTNLGENGSKMSLEENWKGGNG